MRYNKLAGYRYRLVDDTRVDIPYFREYTVRHAYFGIEEGVLTVRAGYCWDGPSGPTVATRSMLSASLAHDALYQLIASEVLPEITRADADYVLYRIANSYPLPDVPLGAMRRCWRGVRALYYFTAVRLFGGLYLRKKKIQPIDVVYEC